LSWPEFLAQSEDSRIGTEHVVEGDGSSGLIVKITRPPGFGLIPELIKLPVVVATPSHHEPDHREVIEFLHATPLEYLSRWLACNEVFGDDVQLASVVQWSDGHVSFVITQPQYHGVPAESRDIEDYFQQAGWSRLHDSSGHAVFFNYAFQIMAIDAERRNCFVNRGGLQPFDVILCVPNAPMERFLKIYPE